MKYLIVGLGNVGLKYANTRHNVGFDVLDAMAEKFEGNFQIDKYAETCVVKSKGRQFILIKPSTYMNLSGKAVKYWLNKLKLEVDQLLVVVDDISLDLGKLRVRSKGSHGGHNGLRDIERELETSNYARLRFGVGNDFPKGRQVDYVLGNWTENEYIDVQNRIPTAIEIISSFGTIGVKETMNSYNNK